MEVSNGKKNNSLNRYGDKKAKPKEKEYSLCDGYGLLLRIKPNGSKLWLFNYIRPILGTRTNLGLGTYPIVSLAEARMLRDDCRKLLAQQIDPKNIEKN